MEAIMQKARVFTGVVAIGLGGFACSEKSSDAINAKPDIEAKGDSQLDAYLFSGDPANVAGARIFDRDLIQNAARQYREQIQSRGTLTLGRSEATVFFEMLTEAEEVMRNADVDNKVLLLQGCLALAGRLPVASVDGIYLQKTWEAVGSDEAGLRTMAALAAELIPSEKLKFSDPEIARRVKVIAPLLERMQINYDRPMLSFHLGNESTEIKAAVVALQTILKESGFLKGAVDGNLGTGTMGSVNAFRERYNGVQSNADNLLSNETDAVGRKTIRALVRNYMLRPTE